MNDKINPKDVQDFEMGGGDPKVNRYTENIVPKSAPNDAPKVNPVGEPPKAGVSSQEAGNSASGVVSSQQVFPDKKINPAGRKKAVLGCLGALGSVMLIFLILAFVFIAQSGSGDSPIAKLLGLNAASFVNGLITLVHIIFLLTALIAFVFTMVGLFRASMAKKDDRIGKKEGLKMSLVSGSILILVLVIWMFAYLYLDSKRMASGEVVQSGIVTTPEETLGLTAPVEVSFDASNLPIDSKKFQIIAYHWDFADGETGTNQIVSHIFKDKGKDGDGVFDVILTVKKRDKKTSDEVVDTFVATVTISNQALSAIITATPQSGPAPLEVEFDASESVDPDGEITRYEWDLDEDGEYDDAEGVKIKHKFTKIGKYTVSLRVTSTTNEYSIVDKEIIVEEESLPKAVIEIADEPEEFVKDFEYIFKGGTSTSPNGEIEKYEWDFGDGTKIEKNRTVSHTFTKEGSYEVTLKVIDETGEEGEISKTVIIGLPMGTPQPKITTNPAADSTGVVSGSVPLKVSFDGSQTVDSDDNIVDYEWDFNSDGTFDAFGQKADYTYALKGTYTATLKVTDADGNSGTKEITVEVSEQGIIPILEVDKVEGTAPLTVKFDASGSTYQDGQITSYRWNFGDGTAEKLGSAQMSHRYDAIGLYTAKVTVIGSDNKTATAEIAITVRGVELSACFSSVFTSGKAPLETTFDPGCSSGTISSYFWDFGDGATSSQVKPSHTFTAEGEYTVTLQVSDADNTVSEIEKVITVTD